MIVSVQERLKTYILALFGVLPACLLPFWVPATHHLSTKLPRELPVAHQISIPLSKPNDRTLQLKTSFLPPFIHCVPPLLWNVTAGPFPSRCQSHGSAFVIQFNHIFWLGRTLPEHPLQINVCQFSVETEHTKLPWESRKPSNSTTVTLVCLGSVSVCVRWAGR